jgi:hypothetical protein
MFSLRNLKKKAPLAMTSHYMGNRNGRSSIRGWSWGGRYKTLYEKKVKQCGLEA